MCEQATSVLDGLQMGPVFVDSSKMPNTGNTAPALNVFPSADGVQHCEITGMRDTLDTHAAKPPKWSWLLRRLGAMNWEVQVRKITHGAPVHPTVRGRFWAYFGYTMLDGAYRPKALQEPDDFKRQDQP
jgi:hypothetical protein